MKSLLMTEVDDFDFDLRVSPANSTTGVFETGIVCFPWSFTPCSEFFTCVAGCPGSGGNTIGGCNTDPCFW